MHWNKWIRESHRWLSIAFTLVVIANFAAIGVGKPMMLLYYLPLPPLFLLLFSGLYMFALPYAAKWPAARRSRSRDTKSAATIP